MVILICAGDCIHDVVVLIGSLLACNSHIHMLLMAAQ